MSLYDTDFHAWANEQAEAVRRRSWNELDWENVAEELETLGRQTENELFSHYRVLLLHLLKWVLQPNLQGASWRGTIKEQRRAIARHIRKNPSLKSSDQEIFAEAYEAAVLRAVVETGLPEKAFPSESPFTANQAKDDDFWPEPDQSA